MTSQIGYWILVALGFGFLIFIHELGHFVAARCVGIRVIRFALGFGPRLFGRKVGPTDYCICAVPFGGYVKMAGGEGEEAGSGAADEYPSKTPGQRALVVAAGPIMSILIALPLLLALFLSGMERPVSRVSFVAPGGPAWNAGVQRGDLVSGIREAGDSSWHEIRFWRQVLLNGPLRDYIGNIVLRVERDGKVIELPLTTEKDPETGRDTGRLGIGAGVVGRDTGFIQNRIGYVPAGSVVDKAGVRTGDEILQIGGQRVFTARDVTDVVERNPGRDMTITLRTPAGETRTEQVPVGVEKFWTLGLIASRSTTIKYIRDGFPARNAGLQEGDTIIAVNGQPIQGWPDLRRRVLEALPGRIALGVRRGAETKTFEIDAPAGEDLADVLGIAPEDYPVVEGYLPGSKAEAAGVQIGAKLISVRTERLKSDDPDIPLSGVDFVQYAAFSRAPLDSTEHPEPYWLSYEIGGQRKTAALSLVPNQCGEILFAGEPALNLQLETAPVVPAGHPLLAVWEAIKETCEWCRFALKALWLLVTGHIALNMLSGPVSILPMTYFSAVAGFSKFIEFLVIITVHLGVLNLVPFPVLDGGHLAFMAIEKIRRKPLPDKVIAALMTTGWVLLIILMIYVTKNDIMRLTGWFG